jgi:hypothetical protein
MMFEQFGEWPQMGAYGWPGLRATFLMARHCIMSELISGCGIPMTVV